MTTHTPAFLGLTPDRGVWNATSYGEGAVVGVLDTGIDEKHPSFRDDGMPPPPAKWKGACQPPVRCNNKLIGAASFVGDDTTVDDVGHGTHTAGTAAGRFVEGVSAFGLGTGTAAGMAPGSHLAVYKVCNAQGCFESDLLAGMDAAVKDGIDVLSLSLGGLSTPLDKDPIAIGAFAAVSKGVSVVCAGGNSGPRPSTLSNEAPWILTVAAGSVDRSFRATVQLGDGETFEGESLTQDKHFSSKVYPLYYSQGTNYCDYFDVNITGTVVVCDTETPVPPTSSIEAVKEAGGAGIVFINEPDFGYTIVLEKYYDIPMSQVTETDGTKIMGYAMKGSSKTNHNATIVFNSTIVGVKPAPIVAAFSSRGPSIACPGVLKPDILAPGLNILAAWPSLVPVEGPESYSFNVVSGTSMATPHITGIVALVKKMHPDWSPAAIKSAIMTTSSAVDNDGHLIMDEEHQQASFYSIGAGHVAPAKAVDPGLVYDLDFRDYAGYICALLGEVALKTISGNTSLTCKEVTPIPEAQLNYPAILVPLRDAPFTVNRTVTNVGPVKSKYTAKVDAPKGLTVKVEPAELEFTKVKEKRTFTVTVSGGGGAGQKLAEGSLSWVSHDHVVRSPIVADSSLGG
ncbi:subtilisin-like protease 3 [Phragmites australis]|uniref:subtilisin-like protease 3 n=1 Tax=Phragmites australis TaxID=29695 RepID=UPI002D768A6E|nr:subtilisin-like protease 3 [Phragmites australis]